MNLVKECFVIFDSDMRLWYNIHNIEICRTVNKNKDIQRSPWKGRAVEKEKKYKEIMEVTLRKNEGLTIKHLLLWILIPTLAINDIKHFDTSHFHTLY